MRQIIIRDLDNTDSEELEKLYKFLDDNNWIFNIEMQ